jgi:hypothetical protein
MGDDLWLSLRRISSQTNLMSFKVSILLLTTLLLASCDRRIDDRQEVTHTVPTAKLIPAVPVPDFDASPRERLALIGEEKQNGPFVYQAPIDWMEGKSGPMRLANFSFGPAGEGECYLSILQGQSGGVEENINRWRKQLELEPMTDADMASLGTVKMMSSDAYFVDLKGDFKGVGQDEAKKGYRMLGAILPLGEMGATIFVKMTGPEALVEEHLLDFKRFCYYLKIGESNG